MSADGDIVREALESFPRDQDPTQFVQKALDALARLEAAERELALVLDASEMANRVRVRDELLVAAEAQRDALADALRRIEHLRYSVMGDNVADMQRMKEIARAALAEAGLA